MATKKQLEPVAPAADKKKALAAALSQIEKQFGKGSVMRLGENTGMTVEHIPTGSIGLDLALGIGDVDRTRAHERLRDVEALLAGIRLRNKQAVDVNAERLGVDRVERVLGVDKRSRAAQLLRLCNAVQRNRGLTGGFRSVDLNDSSLGNTAQS